MPLQALSFSMLIAPISIAALLKTTSGFIRLHFATVIFLLMRRGTFHPSITYAALYTIRETTSDYAADIGSMAQYIALSFPMYTTHEMTRIPSCISVCYMCASNAATLDVICIAWYDVINRSWCN